MTPSARQKTGISDRLIRVPVGVEDTDDIIHDMLQAEEAASTPDGPEPVRHKPSERVFLTTSGARLEYQQPAGDRIVVTHTFVPETLRGKGTAARLMEALREHARRKGILVTATCDFARAYLERKEIQQ